jgi:hypothetical protein
MTSTVPHLTLSDVSYAITDLSDRCKLLASDLLRTVQEYQTLLSSYRQSLTLTSAYSGGLKTEVEKAELPQVFDYAVDEKTPVIKIDEKSYDASNLPDEVKNYVNELVRVNNQKTNLEYRLRQLDAARSAFTKAIEVEIEETKPSPMDPQPDSSPDSDT